jgi:glycosyltransferase involved in cell wall biosynthesis
MKVFFYLDRVMHYHELTFRAIENRLEREGGEFVVASGQPKSNSHGRVALSKPVVKQHLFLRCHEWEYGTYTVRWQPMLANMVRRFEPDVLIVMGHVGCLTYWRLGWLRKQMGFKYLTWQCGYEYNPGLLKSTLTNRFLRQFDYHLAYHTEAKRYLLSHGVDDSRITVMHNTINEREIALLPRDEARQIVAGELGLPLDRPIVLYVGAVLAEKKLDRLIGAVRLLKRGAVSLVIVGDGAALANLKCVAADLEYVRFPGRVLKGVGRFFDAADIFVLPGTGGLAINEAMAHSLPIITALADGSAADLIIDGVNGYILQAGDSREIAARLEILLGDPETRRKMGEVSRELITTKYSFRTFIGRVIYGLHAAIEKPQNISDPRLLAEKRTYAP